MAAAPVPPPRAEITEWQTYEREFRTALLAEDEDRMFSLWKVVLVFVEAHRTRIPVERWPENVITCDVRGNTDAWAIAGWLGSMADWSRRQMQDQYAR